MPNSVLYKRIPTNPIIKVFSKNVRLRRANTANRRKSQYVHTAGDRIIQSRRYMKNGPGAPPSRSRRVGAGNRKAPAPRPSVALLEPQGLPRGLPFFRPPDRLGRSSHYGVGLALTDNRAICAGDHCPPLGAAMDRAFISCEIPRKLVTPARLMSSTMDRHSIAR